MRLSAAKPRCAPKAYADAGAEAARSRAGRVRRLGAAWVLLALALQPVLAQSGAQPGEQPGARPAPPAGKPVERRPSALAPTLSLQRALRAKLNQDTLVIAAGRPGTGYMAMAGELAAAAGASGGLRLLPVAAEGGIANLQDLLFLRGIDLAIVSANVLAHAKATNAFGKALAEKVAYVTALYGEAVHVVARREIAAVGDLRGQRIAIGAGDGTAQFTARDILRHLGLEVDGVPMAPADALEEVRVGRLAAALLVGAKPMAQVSALPKDGSLRLLSLPIQSLPSDGYAPAVFVAEDYPALIPPGAIVETVAVNAVLMTHRSGDGAGRRAARHLPAVLAAIGTLAASERHPSWRNVNLGAVLPGWVRAEAAEKWLNVAFAQRKERLKGAPAGASGPLLAHKKGAPASASAPLLAQKPVKSSGLAAPSVRRKLLEEFEAWASQSTGVRPAPE